MTFSHLPRRRLIASAPLLALAGTAAASPPDIATPDIATPSLEAIERRLGAKLGVCAIRATTPGQPPKTIAAHRADDRFPFCSSFKAPLAARVLWLVDRGRLRLDRRVRYRASDLLVASPVTSAHLADGALTVEALCAAAVQFSDNTAANLLLRETGGPAALTAWMRETGDPAFRLSHTETALNVSRFGDPTDTTTPRAMAESFHRLVLGDALAPASRETLASWLVACRTGARRLRAGLPAAWRIGDKTGTWDDGWCSTIDIAVAWPPGAPPVVIAGFVTDGHDTAIDERALAETASAVAARL